MQHELIEGAGAKNSHPIATSAMELLASIVEVLGPNPSFLTAYQGLWNKVTTYINEWNTAEDLVSCFVLAEGLLETFGEDAQFVVPGIISSFSMTSTYRNEYCRANTFYLLTLLFDIFPKEMEVNLAQYTEILRNGLVRRDGDVCE